MSQNNISKDIAIVVNGLMRVMRSKASLEQARCNRILRNSSVLKETRNLSGNVKKTMPTDLGDISERARMVPVGMSQFLEIYAKYGKPTNHDNSVKTNDVGVDFMSDIATEVEGIELEKELENIYIQSLGVEILQQNKDGKEYCSQRQQGTVHSKLTKHEEIPIMPTKEITGNEKDKEELKKIGQMTFQKFREKQFNNSKTDENEFIQNTYTDTNSVRIEKSKPKEPQLETKSTPKLFLKPLSKEKPTSQLSRSSKQRRVPSSRLGRLVSYGGLAAGLGMGAIAEVTKRSLGLVDSSSNSSLLDSSPFLTEANAARIVDTLCRVRGAALKIGQILSIQDNSMINPQLQKVFERVRHAADFMPHWQMEQMLAAELGADWRTKISQFDDKPFAAASIGQVHMATLLDGRPVAIKIQYPGVAQGINSDIDNLVSVLNVWNIIPEGFFINNIITVAKRELAWEVDYIREANCAKKFKELLQPYPQYYVPEVIDELSTKLVYTTELINGIPVDKCEGLDQTTRNRICTLMLNLFFRELFEFKFMQTDPNWANFLYNKETQQIGLLDFGSSREYKSTFVENYLKILQAAAEGDRTKILTYSRDIGFLSGYESKLMENAHTDTVLLLGEALRTEPYDFGQQNMTKRIQNLVPVMVKERLCPPPEEIYSLHRKLSGIFLLCSKLRGKINCKKIFDSAVENYAFEKNRTLANSINNT